MNHDSLIGLVKKEESKKLPRNCLLDPGKDFLHLGFEILPIEAPPTTEKTY